MNREQSPDHPVNQAKHEQCRVRLPGFIIDEDVGLGDVIKKATSIVGIRPCGGCARRAGRLNNWMVFTKRR